jgi:hypothetical protein
MKMSAKISSHRSLARPAKAQPALTGFYNKFFDFVSMAQSITANLSE